MSDNNAWTEEWLKAQQKFVESWSEMSKDWGSAEQNSQTDLWANGLDMWRKTYPFPYPTEPESEQMINQWLEQLKAMLQQQADHWSPMQHQTTSDLMSQWMNPSTSWQHMAAGLLPFQMPGSNPAGYGLGAEFDELNKALSMPGLGFFRESREKQQAGVKLAMDFQQANDKFNQALLRVSIESLQLLQQKLGEFENDDTVEAPMSMRGLYDLWVDVSETCYADFAMSDEYQSLYGDMVNRLMKLKKHYSEMVDESMDKLNLPSRKEMDTVQQRLQETRRDNQALRRELKEIRALLTEKKSAKVSKASSVAKKAVVKKSAAKKAASKTGAGA
ncbi:MAG: hypothetical protein OEY09_12495 [Gammaproteobacteria bacterium]|nr:hypothetical protein [Gammaproteobacteria bacterium]